jgi:hypothetical protein
MLVKQISVFVENARGKLSRVTEVLAENGINIRALSIADTTDFGILRLIVQDPEKAVTVLKANDITVKSTDVIVVEIDDKPSGLNKALVLMRDANVAVEYMYAFVSKNADKAYVILKTDDADKAVSALSAGGVNVIPAKDVYEL